MSAFIVGRDHIRYLVESALRVSKRDGGWFRWFHNGEMQELTVDKAVAVGQMLWEENIASVSYLYRGESEDTLPGPSDKNHLFSYQPEGPYYAWDMVQVLKAGHCYEYQSCEHPDWKTSSALAFIQQLGRKAATKLPGYEEAEWGEPKRLERR